MHSSFVLTLSGIARPVGCAICPLIGCALLLVFTLRSFMLLQCSTWLCTGGLSADAPLRPRVLVSATDPSFNEPVSKLIDSAEIESTLLLYIEEHLEGGSGVRIVL